MSSGHCSNKFKRNTISLLHMLFYQVDFPNKLYTHFNKALLFCLIYYTPIKNRCLSVDWPATFFYELTMKKLKKTSVCMSDGFYRPHYLPNGGIQWLLVKPWTSSIGRCARLHTVALPWPSTRPAF